MLYSDDEGEELHDPGLGVRLEHFNVGQILPVS